jgi:hypothetical protein
VPVASVVPLLSVVLPVVPVVPVVPVPSVEPVLPEVPVPVVPEVPFVPDPELSVEPLFVPKPLVPVPVVPLPEASVLLSPELFMVLSAHLAFPLCMESLCMVLLPLFMLVAPWLMPVLPVRGLDVSVPLVPLSNVPLVVVVPVVFSVPEELFMSLDVLPEITAPELLLVLPWVDVDFFVVVVFFVLELFVRLPDVCAFSPAVMPANINAVKNAFFMIMYLIKNLLLYCNGANALPTFSKGSKCPLHPASGNNNTKTINRSIHIAIIF